MLFRSKSGLVNADEYQAGLLRYGYNADDAALFIQQTDLEIQAAAEKEQERAQATADKVAVSRKASTMTKVLANLDAEIAQYQLVIANINVAAHQKLDETQRKQLQTAKDKAIVAIAEARLKKALLRTE